LLLDPLHHSLRIVLYLHLRNPLNLRSGALYLLQLCRRNWT
jgi:hypothetical protein